MNGTKEFLFNIFRDYLATEEQREKIKKMQAEDRTKLENKEQYSINVFENKNMVKGETSSINSQTTENMQMIKYKENIFTKIFKFIKNIFRRK